MTKDSLRPIEHTALRAIKEAGCGLTFRELYDRCGGSRGRWSFVLAALVRKGALDRRGGGWRDAVITPKGEHFLTLQPGATSRESLPKAFLYAGLHPDGGTRFKRALATPTATDNVLKPGRDNVKLGYEVTKGRHAGRRLYSLTLEEGRTCPPCDMAKLCYGGNMHLARRWEAGQALEDRLRGEVQRNRLPMLVRLHVLGDFYSVNYARMWIEELGVPVFGYTHHHPFSRIGRMLHNAPWETMSIRKSFKAGAHPLGVMKSRGAVTVTDWAQAAQYDAIPCPVQTDDQASCATCGLCWNTERNIAFIQH